jgi:hypothetical protein
MKNTLWCEESEMTVSYISDEALPIDWIYALDCWVTVIAIQNCMGCDREGMQNIRVSHANTIRTAEIEERERSVKRNTSVRGRISEEKPLESELSREYLGDYAEKTSERTNSCHHECNGCLIEANFENQHFLSKGKRYH